MNQYHDTNILPGAFLKGRARGALMGRFGRAVLAFFLVGLISVASSFLLTLLLSFMWAVLVILREMLTSGLSSEVLLQLLENPSYLTSYQDWFNLLNYVSDFGLSVVTGVFHVGLSLFCLNLACGRQENVSDIFYGFKNQFGKSLQISAVYMLAQEVFLLPFNACLYLISKDADPMTMPPFFCAALAGLVLSACLLLHISQSFYLMLDFPGYRAGELLRLSSRVMKGHKTRLLLLRLSFLPLLLLGVLTLGIGNLWITPYRQVTQAFFFLNLMQAREQNS